MKVRLSDLGKRVMGYRYEILYLGFALSKFIVPYLLFREPNFRLDFIFISFLIIFGIFISGRLSKLERTKEAQNGIKILLAFFWAGFVSNVAFYLENWPNRYEGLKHAVAIGSYLLIFMLANKGKLRWFIPFLSFVMIAARPQALLALLPSLVLFFYYELSSGSKISDTKDLLASTSILLVISLLIFAPKALKEFFSLSEDIALHIKTALFSYFIILPLIALVSYILFKAFTLEKNKVKKNTYRLTIVFPLFVLPVLPFFSNNVYLVMLNIFSQIVLVSYFYYKEEKNIIVTLNEVGKSWQSKFWTLAIFISVVFMALFSNFTKHSIGSLVFSKDIFYLWP